MNFFRWLFSADTCYFCDHGFAWSEWKRRQHIKRKTRTILAHAPGDCPRRFL